MAANTTASADLAPRHAARKAAPLKGEDPGLAGIGVFKSVQQNSRLAPLGRHCERPAAAGQQVEVPHGGDEPRMSSLEIARLTGKRHDNVMADARKMLAELYGPGGLLNFQDTQVNVQNGQRYPILLLPKRETLILVSGYSVPMRARIIDRLQELEEAARAQHPALPNFADPASAAIAWAEQFRAKQALALENRQQAEALAAAAPKVGALNRIATATEGAVCLREAAKLAQVPERQYTEFLRSECWIFKHRDGGRWMGYADKEAAGLLELKRTPFTKPDGTEGSNVQVLVTPRGQAKAAWLIERKAPHLRKTTVSGDAQRALPGLATTGAAP